MYLSYYPLLSEDNPQVEIRDDEFRHLIKVLRSNVGDRIEAFNGKGLRAIGEIVEIAKKYCVIAFSDFKTENPTDYHIHLVIAPTKNLDRIEWLVEKCVEIGIHEFSFIETYHSERRILKLERLEKIAVSAAKQSRKYILPKLNPLKKLDIFLGDLDSSTPSDAKRYFGYVPHDPNDNLFKLSEPQQNYIVLIGPEGGFSPEEAEKLTRDFGFTAASLGPYRLRTETAGLAACHTLNLKNQC